MENNYCPKHVNCSLFNGSSLKRVASAEAYKNRFCKKDKSVWTTCKRYIVSEKTGKCPDFVMPNSTYTIEEIIEKMQIELIKK